MRTIAEIEVRPGGRLWIDICLDPAALAIRRQAAGLVHVTFEELPEFLAVLLLASEELSALVSDEQGGDKVGE